MLQGLFIDDVGVGDITKLEKGVEIMHNVGGNMALDGWQVDLQYTSR